MEKKEEFILKDDRKITIVPFHALPCEVSKFTIEDNNAYTEDFGSSFDAGPDEGEEAEPYCCSNRTWERTEDEKEIEKCKNKYNLTDKDFSLICDYLESLLSVGSCGWCS